ncbi:synaptic vesicle 2-related protein-like isoform X1 [Amphiprion ocellaris]|uniref:Major facilitator superfamily (MFS) profile domain-containing protein n=1 Tax=Amphiprion ocellaris TaxID=80972 RepID=A0AAQ5YE93_AMPOC|nr:synaptic vesicle 2-related protein-like isoform X1 [Amphiprion ocellaris]
MDNWTKSAKIAYKRWKNPELRDETDFVGQTDEVQTTDNEICTIASAAPGGAESASSCGSDKTEETFTVDDVLEVIGFGKFQWKISLLTGLSWIADAMEMMILSILGPQLHCEWRLPGYQVALITSVVFVGMGISSPLWGNVSDKYGRRVGLTICMCWTLYYGLMSAFSPVYGWLLVLRGLVGFGIGGAPQSVTLYSEFLPVKSRGICIMLIAAFWAIGTVFEVLLALWVMPTLGWRWLLGLSTIPMAIFVSFCFWLPESPRFDVLTGRSEKAMETLTRVAKENGKTMPQGRMIAYQQSDRGQIKDLFAAQYWRTTLPLWFIWFAYAFSYYGIVLLTTELFQAGDSCVATQGAKIEPTCSLECKYLTSADYKDLLWTTLAEFPGLLVILLAVDHIGRKRSMALCFFMFSLCILPLFACIERTALTILIFVARAFISGGYQVVFVYTPEVFPTGSRALAMGTSSAMARVGALITPFVAQVMLRTSVYLTLSVYCGVAVLAGVASLILPIETLGRSLQESAGVQP